MQWALGLAFLLSGVAALVYQVVWQRLLGFISGTDLHSSVLTVSVFMTGLGLGSLVGGLLADRVGPRRSLVAFAVAQIGVASCGLLSTAVLYDLLYRRLAEHAVPQAVAFVAAFAVLLVPTLLMGASLPLLGRAVVASVERSAPLLAWLQGLNTLGAAAGSLATPWVLVRQFGFSGALATGAALSCLAGALALVVARFGPTLFPVESGAGPSTEEGEARVSFSGYVALSFVSGCLALSMEIIWLRLLAVIVKANSFTFGSVLALLLAGTGLGNLLGSRYAPRSRRPLAWFVVLQQAIAVYAAVSLAFLVACLGRAAALDTLWRYVAEYEGLDIGQAIADLGAWVTAGGSLTQPVRMLGRLYLVLPAGLMLLPSLWTGFAFALMQRAAQNDLRLLGRRVGWLSAANILGCVAGALGTGLVSLRFVGTAGALRLNLVLAAALGLLALRRYPSVLRRREALLGLGAILLAVPTIGNAELWARLHGSERARVIVAEDGSGVSLLRREPYETTVFTNGLGQSWLPFAGVHTLLGALPALVHPAPATVAIIGLGSGDTLFAAGSRPETLALECVEIVGAERVTLGRLASTGAYPGLTQILADPRVRWIVGDGRRRIMASGRVFDVIEADALRPDGAWAGNLYSVEYFRLLRSRLRAGGIAATWAPTPRVRDGFLAVFPHAVEFGDVLLGSDSVLEATREIVMARVAAPATQQYFARAGVDIVSLLAEAYATEPVIYGPDVERPSAADVNTDLYPKDEYRVSR